MWRCAVGAVFAAGRTDPERPVRLSAYPRVTVPDSHPSSDPSDGTVVDPAVIAERRARRAELAEQSLADRVRQAQTAADEQRARALELERGLELAARERDGLRADLEARESELRGLRQREESERRRRHEVEVESDADRRALEGDIGALRARLATAEARATELSAELTRAQAHAESLRAEVERQRAARERLEQGARDVTDLSRALESRRDGIDAELGSLRERTAVLTDELAAEAGARARAEAALSAEHDRAGAEITLLQAELDRRAQIHDAVHGQLRALGAEVGRLRDGLAVDAEQRAATERTLVEVAATAHGLRAELAELETRRTEAEAALSVALGELEAARRAVVTEADARAEAEATVARQRAEFAEQRAAVEQTVAGLRASLAQATTELQDQLEQERGARLVAEQGQAAALASVEQARHDADARVAAAEAATADERAQSAALIEVERARLAETLEAERTQAGIVLEAERHQHQVVLEAERARAEAGIAEATRALEAERDEARAALAQAQQALEAERGRAEAGAAELLVERRRADEGEARAAGAIAERDRLAAELARREAMDDRVRDTLRELRAELDDVRTQSDARTAREAAVERLVGDLVDTARSLREGFDRELDEVRGRLTEQAADERRTELAAAEERLAAMRAHLESSVDRLRTELDAEQAARRDAEAALAAERGRVEAAGMAAVDAAVSRDELARELDERRAAEDDVRAALVAAERELSLLRREHGGQADAVAVVESLTRAAQRLREETAVDVDTAAVAPEPADPAADAAVAAPSKPSPRPVPAAAPEPIAEPAVAAHEGTAPMRPLVVPVEGRPTSGWMAAAFKRLAADDPELALGALLAILPAQGPVAGRDLRYDLTVRGHGTWRVALRSGHAEVAPPARDGGDPDVSVVGTIEALAPFAAGGIARRPVSVDVVGPRRRLRRLVKARREPVSLLDVAAASVAPLPPLLLGLVAAGVDPAWTADEPLTVDVVVDGDGGGTWRIAAPGDGPLRISLVQADDPAADATLHVARAALLPLLAALPLPPGERLLVSGDPAAARRLTGWFARAQGLPVDTA
jgi:hypothetical protein